MDPDWTLLQSRNPDSGSKWTREEDKAFEDALALYSNEPNLWYKIALAVPSKSLEDLKLHYETLVDDVASIESDEVPLPCYDENVTVGNKRKRNQSSATSVRRGVPWTETEHRQFISGLEKYGRGDWKSISRYSVMTKSNSQVASHAQKYFKRLKNSAKKDEKGSNNIDMESMVPEIPFTEIPITEIPITEKASTSEWKPPQSPIPFGGNLFGSKMIIEDGTAPLGTPERILPDLPFAIDPIEGVGPTVEMQESSTPDEMDVDVYSLPDFLDID